MHWRYGKKRTGARTRLERSDPSSASLPGVGKRWPLGLASLRGVRRLVVVLGYTTLVTLISVFVFLHISQYVKMTEIKFRIGKLKGQFAQVKRDIQVLQFEFEKMASVTSIEAEASKRLGMVNPSEVIFIPWDEKGKNR